LKLYLDSHQNMVRLHILGSCRKFFIFYYILKFMCAIFTTVNYRYYYYDFEPNGWGLYRHLMHLLVRFHRTFRYRFHCEYTVGIMFTATGSNDFIYFDRIIISILVHLLSACRAVTLYFPTVLLKHSLITG